MVKVKVTETGSFSQYEKEISKKEEDSLVIGKSDRTVTLLSEGESITIKEVAQHTRNATWSGVLSVPTSEGIPFVTQYDRVQMSPNSTLEITFAQPFANRCLQVQATLRSDTNDISIVTAAVSDTNKFQLKRVGGTIAEFVQWQAIGF